MNRRLRFRIDKSRTEKVDAKFGIEMHAHTYNEFAEIH